RHARRAAAGAGERKAATGFVALHMQGEASWTRREYATLAREGFMRNPVVHRSVRLVVEAAAAAPWTLFQGGAELDAHPALDLLARPNPRQTGAAFMEALYGHLLLSGDAYVELVAAGAGSTSPQHGENAGPRELHLLRPDRVAVVEDAAGW